jgi:hypothetical protein
MKAIYPKDDGSVAVMAVSPKSKLSLLEAAKKYVPAGKPFKIVDEEVFPSEDTFFDAWEADFSHPDGHGGDA